MSCLYITEIKPFLAALFAWFSPSLQVELLFMVSFAMQKHLKVWIGSICLFLFLFLLPWETDLRKHCYGLCLRMFCLCSLLVIVWCYHITFIFMSLNHFKLIFVEYYVGHGFIITGFWFTWSCPGFPTPFAKELSFPHFVFLSSLLKINWPQIYQFISGFSILFHSSTCLFFWIL